MKIATADPRLQWLITDDGSRTLWNSLLDETYHSGCGAVAESLVVYLVNSGVLNRLQSSRSTRVLEYGFGTGTAFLLTAAAAELYDTPLTYRGLEFELLPGEIFASLDLAGVSTDCDINLAISGDIASRRVPFAELLDKAQRLLGEFTVWRSTLPVHPPQGIYVWNPSHNVRLELVIGDAVHYDRGDSESFDAVYFDPFSPASAPQLWSERVFRTAYDSLSEAGTFTSYCVKGVVRRGLAEVGFTVHKVPGPQGGKREVLLAWVALASPNNVRVFPGRYWG